MYGVVGDVERLAREAESVAERLQQVARETEHLAEVSWSSTSAERWRGELWETVASIRRDARTAENTANELRAHAAACRRTLDTIGSIRNSFLRSLEEAQRVLANAAGEVSEAALSARAVVERARRMPPPDHLDWLRFP